MAGKTIIWEYMLRDQNGVKQPSQTVVAYPFDTQANGTNPTDLTTGKYRFTFDYDADGVGILAMFYDVYVNSVLDAKKVPIGRGWFWLSTLAVDVTPKTVLFTNLTDENRNALPATINNAKMQILYSEGDIQFYIDTLTTTGFKIYASSGGGAGMPLNVRLKIFVGEA